MIRSAQISDIDKIMRIINDAKRIMNSAGNMQWNENYPLQSDIERDISAGTLYVSMHEGEIAGCICMDGDEPEEYKDAGFKKPYPALILHRMAVDPSVRGKGLAQDMLNFVCDKAKELGANSVRTDTFAGNIAVNRLFQKVGFSKVGEVELKGETIQPFCCYEK